MVSSRVLRFTLLRPFLVAAVTVAALAACDEDDDSKKKVSAPEAVWVYTADYQSDTISAVQVDFEDGAMTEVDGSPYAADAGPWTVLANPAGTQLYMAAGDQDTVQSFEVDGDTGELEEADSVSAPEWPRALAITPDGDYLYVGGYTNSEMDIYDVDASTAELTADGAAPGFLGQPVAATIDPSGSVLYSVQPNVDSVNVYTVEADGSLTDDVFPVVVDADPWALAVSPDGLHLYVVQIADNSVGVHDIVLDGDLSPVETTPTGNFPTGVAITPTGDFVYVTDTEGIRILGRDASTGALTEIDVVPAGTSPEAIAIDATGVILAVVDSQDDTLHVYAIDPDSGTLAESPDSPFAVGEFPRSVTIVNAQ